MNKPTQHKGTYVLQTFHEGVWSDYLKYTPSELGEHPYDETMMRTRMVHYPDLDPSIAPYHMFDYNHDHEPKTE